MGREDERTARQHRREARRPVRGPRFYDIEFYATSRTAYGGHYGHSYRHDDRHDGDGHSGGYGRHTHCYSSGCHDRSHARFDAVFSFCTYVSGGPSIQGLEDLYEAF